MADEGTARTLVTVGAWLALIFWLVGIGIIAWIALFTYPLIDDFFLWLFVWGIVLVAIVVFTIFTIIFIILWFRWKNDPRAHKTGLIITGVFGLFLAYGLPGLLVLIGGAIVPSEKA